MSLDVTAIGQAELVSRYKSRENCHFQIVQYAPFICRLDGRDMGYYKFSGERMDFYAGSCGLYNEWRNLLSLAVLDVPIRTVRDTPIRYGNKPFFELLQMSDCEGAIGPETSAKLAKDFRDYLPRMEFLIIRAATRWGCDRCGLSSDPEEFKENIAYCLQKYALWTRAFEIASDNGFVIFH